AIAVIKAAGRTAVVFGSGIGTGLGATGVEAAEKTWVSSPVVVSQSPPALVPVLEEREQVAARERQVLVPPVGVGPAVMDEGPGADVPVRGVVRRIRGAAAVEGVLQHRRDAAHLRAEPGRARAGESGEVARLEVLLQAVAGGRAVR